MKKCTCCENDKDISEFYKKSGKDGMLSICKSCCYEKHKKWVELNPDKNKERMRKYNTNNAEKVRQANLKWQKDNPEKMKKMRDSYLLNNPEYVKNYKEKNKESLKKKRNDYHKKRTLEDTFYKFSKSIRTMIGKSIKNCGYTKRSRTYEILGCSFEEFKLYIESKFEPWMNWDNKGLYNGELNYGWDIDHIIPLRVAKNEEDLVKLSHYTNLQPLCSKVNRDIKSDKLSWK